jgi:hypothetical protein
VSTVPIVLLGAQRFEPTLGAAAAAIGIAGKIATVTAGWQERELEDQELHEHLHQNTVNLRLYERADRVFKADKELQQAHRARQERMRLKQDFYRIRLEHELDAAHVIEQRKAPPDILEEERVASIAAIRELDDYHLGICGRERQEWHETWKPLERPAVKAEREQIEAALEGTAAVAIAGGHVATLLNRLELFGMGELLRGRPILAWTGGAMAISERVVLFHDNPPQGPGAAEILDRGLGLCPSVVPLPSPEQRLRLGDRERVSRFARRFAPALSLAMPARAHITWNGLAFVRPYKIERLVDDGSVERLGWPEEATEASVEASRPSVEGTAIVAPPEESGR